LKRLFKKLGKDTEEKDGKAKSIRLTTSISVHDLENKKRKSIEFLKSYSTLKFFMKVNVYEPENIQKGRLMLLNIAEDLKEYSKIKVSPAAPEEKQVDEKKEKEKKPTSAESIKKMAEKQANFVKIDTADIDDDDYQDEGDRASYLYMELTSTTSFKDNIDIDRMLEHTTLDDFMRGLYTSGTTQATGAGRRKDAPGSSNILGALMSGRGLEELTE